MEELLNLPNDKIRDTKILLIESGALAKIPSVLMENFYGNSFQLVADSTTYEIAGKEIEENLINKGLTLEKSIIFPVEGLYARYEFVDQLVDEFKKHRAIPIAVGSGTINDLVKRSAFVSQRRYICVATAASMDGYTAYGASITANGAKQTFDCPAPYCCIADVDLIRNAPTEYTASGYADLFAKVTAGADWIIADALGIEPIDNEVWHLVQGALHTALAEPDKIRERDLEETRNLIEGLIIGGFGMQVHQTSRPASGAEHQMSHLWNMEHHTNKGEAISHGFQVAVGTMLITALYYELLKSDIEGLDIDEALTHWPTREELEQESLALFEGTDFPTIGATETLAKYNDHEEVREQLELLKRVWPSLKVRLEKQLIPLDEVIARLQAIGAPSKPEDIDVSRAYLKRSCIRAQYIRRRFTLLDLGVRTNLLPKWLDNLFGKGGIWEIN